MLTAGKKQKHKRSISWSNSIEVIDTFSKTEYDRTSAEVAALTPFEEEVCSCSSGSMLFFWFQLVLREFASNGFMQIHRHLLWKIEIDNAKERALSPDNVALDAK